ncbi:hypothetical protein BYT27DRAFT_7261265 [Phlegmacium glaucopus]|nr:hypothetical protein BYT27DRAFT_7261265 [Phlegmacium glaucopus]
MKPQLAPRKKPGPRFMKMQSPKTAFANPKVKTVKNKSILGNLSITTGASSEILRKARIWLQFHGFMDSRSVRKIAPSKFQPLLDARQAEFSLKNFRSHRKVGTGIMIRFEMINDLAWL